MADAQSLLAGRLGAAAMADDTPKTGWSTGAKLTLGGVMGTSFAAMFTTAIVDLEGDKRVGYLDVAGIATKCSGDTVDAVVGRLYSERHCRESTERQALAHIVEVRRCTPNIHRHQLVAAGLLAYNIGGPNYCGSTAAMRFNAGDLRGGCAAFAPWHKITVDEAQARRMQARGETCTPSKTKPGRFLCTVQGLKNRRAVEAKICFNGL